MTTPKQPPYDPTPWYGFAVLAALGLLCLLCSGCASKRVEQEVATKTERTVTKTEEHYEVNVVVDVPGSGPAPITGGLTRTTYSETLTESEAQADRQSRTQVDTAAILTMVQQAVMKAAGGYATGGVLGSIGAFFATPEGAGLGLATATALAHSLKKSRDARQDRDAKAEADRRAAEAKARADAEESRRTRAEKDADEGWDIVARRGPAPLTSEPPPAPRG